MKNYWNLLDFIIVVISIISVTVPDDGSENLATFKVIRMARLLRPIRVISKNEGLKISLQALYVSVPSILNLLVIVLLFMAIFAIVGVNLFKGKFEYCDIPDSDIVHLTQEQLGTIIVDSFDCYNYGGICDNNLSHQQKRPLEIERHLLHAGTVQKNNSIMG